MYVWEHVRTHYTDGDFWRREHHGMFLSRGLKWYWGKIISPETIIAGHTVPFCFRIDLMQSSLYLLSEAAPLHRSPQGIRRCSNPSGRCCPWCNTRPCLHGQGFGSSCGRPAHWLDSGMGSGCVGGETERSMVGTPGLLVWCWWSHDSPPHRSLNSTLLTLQESGKFVEFRPNLLLDC